MPASIENVANQFFDYIIVGGGTAGLTLAARLSEDATKSVLVLESGGANLHDPNILRPASYGSHFGNKDYSWEYHILKQKHANDRESTWMRGRGLGGSSCNNFMCWTKPPSRDIDDIERLGNPGWNWDSFEVALERTEGFVEPPAEMQRRNNMKSDTWTMGREGPLSIAFPANINPVDRIVQQTLLNSGLPAAPRPFGGNPNGVFFAPNNYDPKTHTRSYSTTAFYIPNKDRPNLSVMVNATVYRVLTEQTGNGQLSAIGIEFEYDNQIYFVNAREEVILSAGGLKSPHILELSGIGRKDVLTRAEIPMKLELPGVGENVQEHVFLGMSWELKEDVPFETLDVLRNPLTAAKHMELHASSGLGLYTSGIVDFAFTTLDRITSKSDAIYQSMTEMLNNLDPETSPPGLSEQYKIMLERFEAGNGSPGCEFIGFPGLLSLPNPPAKGKQYVSIVAAMNYMFSRGSIHARSGCPATEPEFDPHYFEQSVDLDILTEMCKFVRKMADIPPLKDIIAKNLNPGPEVQTDDQMREWVKETFRSTWHTVGSCSMLPLEKGGVVDPTLRVYGTNNLRVVDISIFPLHFGGHSQSAAYAIAEQAADIIQGRCPA